MIVGIGCDIVEIKRIKASNEKFYKRVLTPNEQEVFHNMTKQRQIEFLAGRFVAKEAIYKACNALQTISNIEILNDENGKPYCIVEGYTIHISIAHEKEYAIAYAICEK